MNLHQSLALIEDPRKFAREQLTDQEALDLAYALLAEEALLAYEKLAGEFPRHDEASWPFPYEEVHSWRMKAATLLTDHRLRKAAFEYYRADRPAEFTEHWGTTYDPRNGKGARAHLPKKMPMLLFKRQRELFEFFLACTNDGESGLVEKSRDMGATWIACFFSVWLWLFHSDSAIGWGSRKEELVDQIGDPKSVFEKLRMAIDYLPPVFLPARFVRRDHMPFMKIINPENGSTIIGEVGDNIGRGGRTEIYFKDESAHYVHPESIEAALGDNTDVQIDISSVNGLGNVFHRRREAGKDWMPGQEMEPGEVPVFVMDWRDHPGKDQPWYDRRRAKAVREGLLHKFKQEVDRDYAGALEGNIIPAEWVRSAIGAREKLGIADRGLWRAALDVADGGGDTNALALAKGIELKSCEDWGERDTGATARRAVTACAGLGFVDLQYDSVGVGSGVKAEANRLADEGLMPPMLSLVPWNAGARVQEPDEPIIPGDMDSPLNGDFYDNFKAQAWWRVRQRFEKTHRAVQALDGGDEFTYDPDELISIDPDIPQLRQLEKELSQPTASRSTRTLKLIVNKTPEGTRSPNLADAVVMAFNPLPGLRPVYAVAASEIEQTPFKVPPHWKRAYAMKVEPSRVCVLWGAHDPDGDILYVISEHARSHAEPSAHAQAVRARGKWQLGFLETERAGLDEIRQQIDVYRALELNVDYSERALEAGINDMQQRVSTGRFKAFLTCTEFMGEYRAYRRDDSGAVMGSGLIDCARILCRPSSLARMIVKPVVGMEMRRPGHVGDRRAGY